MDDCLTQKSSKNIFQMKNISPLTAIIAIVVIGAAVWYYFDKKKGTGTEDTAGQVAAPTAPGTQTPAELAARSRMQGFGGRIAYS